MYVIQLMLFIILSIVPVSGLLGFWQDRGGSNAVEKLLSIVQIKAAVLRDGSSKEIPVEEIVPGDIVILNAGDIVPGNALVQESNDLFIDEAMLTGETFPVEKVVAVLPAETPLGQRTNALWMGTHVVSGSATALIIRTGKETEFGQVSERLKLRPKKTEFERGIQKFGYFLMEVTLCPGCRHLCHQCLFGATSPGLISVFPGTCRWANLAIASRDYQPLWISIHYIF